MRVLFFDTSCGISGDMTVGALLDLGADEDALRRGLGSLPLRDEFEIEIRKVNKGGIMATDFSVISKEQHVHARHLSEIQKILRDSALNEKVLETALTIFQRLAEAEAQVHGVDIEEVHFHEVGAVDAIVDVVGAAICLKSLDVHRICASPVNTGSGSVACAHGVLPVPAPAVAQLLIGTPAYSSGVMCELTTPTGAAIITTVSESFGSLPMMTLLGTGYGAGKKDLNYPNCLRVILGETGYIAHDVISSIETNIDDMSGEICGYVMERLMEAGALDCYYTPIQMKKSRPAYQLTVLCRPQDERVMENILFRETSTLGVRKSILTRDILPRRTETVDGVRVKVWEYEGARVSAEYEDCRKLAQERGLPIRVVMEQIETIARENL